MEPPAEALLHGEFGAPGARAGARYAVTLTLRELRVRRLGPRPEQERRLVLPLCHVLGCRAGGRPEGPERPAQQQGDQTAHFAVYCYLPKRRLVGGTKGRQRLVKTFQVDGAAALCDNQRVAERWSTAINCVLQGVALPGEADITPSLLPRSRRILLLANPHSGKSLAMTYCHNHILPMIAEANISYNLICTEYPNHAWKLVQDIELSEWDAIVIVSGDGLLHEVINGLMERPDWEKAIKTPVGILPAGSGNALAAAINHNAGNRMAMGEELLVNCTLLLCRGVTAPMDLVSVTTAGGRRRFSFLGVAWGFVADVDIESERYRALGAARFTLGTLVRLASLRRYRGRLSYLPAPGPGPRPRRPLCRSVTASADGPPGPPHPPLGRALSDTGLWRAGARTPDSPSPFLACEGFSFEGGSLPEGAECGDDDGDRSETRPGDDGDRSETRPGDDGDRSETRPGDDGDRSETRPGDNGDHSETRPGDNGDHSETRPGDDGDRSETRSGDRSETRPGDAGCRSETRPGDNGDHSETRPGDNGDRSETRPGDNGDRSETRPGDRSETRSGDRSETRPGDDGDRSETRPGDRSETRSGDRSETRPGDDGDRSETRPGDDGDRSETRPGDNGDRSETRSGDRSETRPGDDGDRSETRPGDRSETRPGDDGDRSRTRPGDRSETRPGDNGDRSETRPGDDGDHSETRPGDNGDRSETRPGDRSETRPGDDGDRSETRPGDDGDRSRTRPGDRSETRPGDNGDRSETRPGDDGDRSETRPGDDGDRSRTRPGDDGDRSETRPGDNGDRSRTRPGDDGDRSETRPGDRSETRPGDDGDRSRTRPGDNGDRSETRPGDNGDHSETRPGDAGCRSETRPADDGDRSRTRPADDGDRSRTRPGDAGRSSGSEAPPRDGLLPPLGQPLPAHWQTVEGDFVLVLALYQSHLGADLLAAPFAGFADRLLHLCYVTAGISRAALLRLFLAMETGAHFGLDCPHLACVPALAFRLEPLTPHGTITIDGERVEYGPLQAQVHGELATLITGAPPSTNGV